ncbi:MAG: VWA domain-containing protein [Candidatus Schekmanbacteria bacterium]|nr:VWA domain-containing protein [Candidatus Schekmanbacteria bacterium]
MFIDFFERLREAGIPVSPTELLRLHRGLSLDLARSNLDAFYLLARTVLVKHEKYFDAYDRVFLEHFRGVELAGEELLDKLDQAIRDWLDDPRGLDEEMLARLRAEIGAEAMGLDELRRLFLQRLAEQSERHDGGNRWIGTGGTSPFGHSGFHPGGFRIGGGGGGRSAIKVAGERRYKDYSAYGEMGSGAIKEALARLRHLVEHGVADELDLPETLRRLDRTGGDIEIVLRPGKRNRVRVLLLIDNGGWSMDPYVVLVSRLFAAASSCFRQLSIYYFHNCIYQTVWSDPPRTRPVATLEVMQALPEAKVFVVGDAAMSPTELFWPDGCIEWTMRNEEAGKVWLERLRDRFPAAVWLNPLERAHWARAYGHRTVAEIGKIFPMFDLTLDGLTAAIEHLQQR